MPYALVTRAAGSCAAIHHHRSKSLSEARRVQSAREVDDPCGEFRIGDVQPVAIYLEERERGDKGRTPSSGKRGTLVAHCVGIMIREDLQCFGTVSRNASPGLEHLLAHAFGRCDDDLAAIVPVHDDLRTDGKVIAGDRSRDRDDGAVADAANLDDVHGWSIHAYIHVLGMP